MNIKTENQGSNINLVYTVSANDEIDELSLGMISNNKIEGLIPIQFTQLDITMEMKFNITGKIKLSDLYSRIVNKELLVETFISIIDTVLNARMFMIDDNRMLLDLEYLYIEKSTKKIEMICLPIVRDASNLVKLEDFFKNIMFNTKFSQKENCDYVVKIINYLNGISAFSIVEFKSFLKNSIKDPMPPIAKEKVAFEFKERAYLIRRRNNQKIYINKKVFKIGRKREFVDYQITENKAVGRCHANILSIEQRYFLVDMNSTNHTFVNGVKIDSNKKVLLADNTRIKFANEEFIFHTK